MERHIKTHLKAQLLLMPLLPWVSMPMLKACCLPPLVQVPLRPVSAHRHLVWVHRPAKINRLPLVLDLIQVWMQQQLLRLPLMVLPTMDLRVQPKLPQVHRFLWVGRVMRDKSNTLPRVKFLLLPPMLLMAVSFIKWLFRRLIHSNLTVIAAQRLNANLVVRSTLKVVQLAYLLIIILV